MVKHFFYCISLCLPTLMLAQIKVNNQGAYIKVSDQANLKIQAGGLRNELGGQIHNQGQIYVQRDFEQNTGASYEGHPTTSWLNFDGGIVQEILADAPVYISRLRLNNATNLSLQQTVHLSHVLDLQTAGNLFLNTFDVWADTAQILNYDQNNYLHTNNIGRLHRSLALGQVKDYPIGDGSYNLLTLGLQAGAIDLFSARVQDVINANGNVGPSRNQQAVNRTWHIDEANPGGNSLDLTVEWDSSEELPNFNRTDASLAYWDGAWLPDGCFAAQPRGPARWSLSRFNQTSFSPFAVLNAVSIPIISGDSIRCAGLTTVLTASGSENSQYTWSTGATGPNVAVQPLSTTTYSLTATNGFGCTATTDFTITVNPNPSPIVFGPLAICAGQTANLSVAGSGGSLAWYDASLSSPLALGSTYTTPTLNQNTTYYVREVDANACQTLSPVQVLVEPTPNRPSVVSPSFVCEGQARLIAATGSGQGNLRYYDAGQNLLFTYDMTAGPSFTYNAGSVGVGTYNFFVSEVQGSCESPLSALVVEVGVSPPAPVVAPDTICAGQSALLLAPTTVFWYADLAQTQLLAQASSYQTPALTAASTVYYVVSQNAQGCRSASGLAVVSTRSLPLAPVVAADTVCQGNAATLSAMGQGGTLTWYSDANGLNLLTTGDTLNLNLVNQTTTYYVRETSLAACLGPIAPVQVLVSLPLTPPAVAPVFACDGQDLILQAGGSGTGQLVFFSNANQELGRVAMSLQQPSVNLNLGPFPIGRYNFTVLEAQGNCRSAPSNLDVEIRALPQAPAVFNDSPVCEGEEVFVQAAGLAATVYEWTGPNNFFQTSQTFVLRQISTNQAGTYELRILQNGCRSLPTSTNIQVNARPISPTINQNGPLCEGQTLNLSANNVAPNLNYNWTGPNGFSSNLASPSIVSVREAMHQGFYNLRVIDPNTGCASSLAASLVMVSSLPNVGAISNTSPSCEGEQVQLLVQSLFAASYAWSGPDGFSSNLRTPFIEDLNASRAGVYTVTVTANGCSTTLSTDVLVRPSPLLSIIADTTIELGNSLRLFATGGMLYEWSPAEFLSSPTSATPLMSPTRTGIFRLDLSVTDVQGCRANASVEVSVVPSTQVRIPDLITPNADGANDVWHLDFLLPLSSYQIEIFSRGGLQVFRTEAYQQDWDGRHYETGKILPDGTYFYIIRLADGTEYRGPVTIKR